MFAGCHSTAYHIKGTAEGFNDGDTLFLTHDLEQGIPSDTVLVSDGKFSLEGDIDSVELCMVYSADRNEINAPFFLEPGTVTIHISEAIGQSRVGGTTSNNEWQRLNDSVMVIGKEINRIAEHIYGKTVSQEEQQQGMNQIERLNERFSAVVLKAVERNIDNEFGCFLLTYYPEEVISNEDRLRLIQQLPTERRNRSAVKAIEESIKRAENTATGNTIPAFEQPTPDGTPLNIMNEVQQHAITILDFWASWCGPCRQAMPEMIELYNQYKDQGLGIVGISLDEDYDAWTQAIKTHSIPWPQMSDLKGWDNAAAQLFNISAIPHIIVVDSTGKILARGLRGEDLEQFVADRLK